MNYELVSGMLITIGKAVKPFGVKGEMKIEPMTDFPDRFKGLRRVYLVSPAGKEIECEVRSVRYAGGAPYLLFGGYDSPEKARALNGWFIKIPVEEAVPLPEGTYYWFELIGMEVLSEAGDKLGTITDIFETGSNDVYVVKRGRKEFYIPATQEVIRQVDRKAKQMVIHLMDGLME
ncbi:MAG TPA: ribosome maturation factor RimM [Nitrospirota bacterium]